MAKHFVPEIEEDSFGWKRDETKIAEEAALHKTNPPNLKARSQLCKLQN